VRGFIAASNVTKEQMAQHIRDLCARHDIRVVWLHRTAQSYSIRKRDGAANEIGIVPVRSAISYAVALHEIGHIIGRKQTSHTAVGIRERWAWKWAQENALNARAKEYAWKSAEWWSDQTEGLSLPFFVQRS